MKRSMAVLRYACLALGLLAAQGRSAWAECVTIACNPPISAVDFGGVLIGNSAFATIGVPGQPSAYTLVTAITGPNTIEFAVVGTTCTGLVPANTPCAVMVRFTPLGCGTRTATLTLTLNIPAVGNCSFPITLTGFGCSIDCAINATQLAITAGTLTTSGGSSILRELLLAGATTGSVRCFHLNCASCFAQTEAARGRTGAQAVIDQITCLLIALCSPVLDKGV
jgi:hypothetical protein